MRILKCESCGAKLKPEEGKFTATCEYCGNVMAIFESTAEFEVDSKGTLVQYNGRGGDVVVPDDVRTIGERCFCHNERVFSVQLPEGLREIKSCAFQACSELEEISLPASLETIGNHAFYQCPSLREVQVPEGILTLKKSTFCDCTGLEKVTLPDSLRKLEDYVFYGCKRLKAVRLPPKLKSLGKNCFAYCESLQQLTPPQSLQEIGSFAFSDCAGLKEFVFPPQLTTIGKYAFSHCVELSRVLLNEGLTSLGENAFYECVQLRTIRTPSTLRRIPPYAFYHANADRVFIMEGCELIEEGAFCANNIRTHTQIFLPGSLSFIHHRGLTWNYYDIKSVRTPVIEAYVRQFDDRLTWTLITPQEQEQLLSDAARTARQQAEAARREQLEAAARLEREAHRQALLQQQQAQERQLAERRAQEDAQRLLVENRKRMGLCPHCGGTYKGMFTKKCSKCGKAKEG